MTCGGLRLCHWQDLVTNWPLGEGEVMWMLRLQGLWPRRPGQEIRGGGGGKGCDQLGRVQSEAPGPHPRETQGELWAWGEG